MMSFKLRFRYVFTFRESGWSVKLRGICIVGIFWIIYQQVHWSNKSHLRFKMYQRLLRCSKKVDFPFKFFVLKPFFVYCCSICNWHILFISRKKTFRPCIKWDVLALIRKKQQGKYVLLRQDRESEEKRDREAGKERDREAGREGKREKERGRETERQSEKKRKRILCHIKSCAFGNNSSTI